MSFSGNRGHQAGRARPSIHRGYKGRGRGGRVHIPGSAVQMKRGNSTRIAPKSWHKVQINTGAKYAKEELLPTLKSNCSVPMAPIAYQKQGPHVVFFVENAEVANALKSLGNYMNLL